MTFMYFIPAYPCRPAGALLDQVESRALNFITKYEANTQAEPKPRRSYCRPHSSSLVSRHKSVTMQILQLHSRSGVSKRMDAERISKAGVVVGRQIVILPNRFIKVKTCRRSILCLDWSGSVLLLQSPSRSHLLAFSMDSLLTCMTRPNTAILAQNLGILAACIPSLQTNFLSISWNQSGQLALRARKSHQAQMPTTAGLQTRIASRSRRSTEIAQFSTNTKQDQRHYSHVHC